MNSLFFNKNVYSANKLISNEVSVEFVGELFSEQNRKLFNNSDYKQSIILLLVQQFLKKTEEIGLLNQTDSEDIAFIVEDYLNKDIDEIIDYSLMFNYDELLYDNFSDKEYELW